MKYLLNLPNLTKTNVMLQNKTGFSMNTYWKYKRIFMNIWDMRSMRVLKIFSESGEKDKRTFRYVRTHPKKVSWSRHYSVFLPKLENFENYILRKKSRRDNYSFYDWKVPWWLLNHARVTVEYVMQPSSPYPASKTKIHKFYFSVTCKICGFQKYDIL